MEEAKKFPLTTEARRVPAILSQIWTRLPSGSRALTPTPTPRLRRQNRILWLALQTLLPRSQGAHLCVIPWLRRPPCPAFKAALSYCSQPTESASAESHSLNTLGLIQLFQPIRALKSFWWAQVTPIKSCDWKSLLCSQNLSWQCVCSPLFPLPWSQGSPLTSERRQKETEKGRPFSERDNFSTSAFSLFWKTLRPHPATRSPMGIPHSLA